VISERVTIKNRAGLHAKPASLFVQNANKFVSDIYVSKGSTRVNAKSIMGVMILSVQKGDDVLLEVSGDDEEAAMAKLIEIIDNKFGLPDE